ncbi:MAG TPA: isoprenylcysteine carboxylmethyltransferase family protein [Bacteroidota bacterium]|nr:isoprenylcysteine carboxylmethyltransferase family protein [Bacteroidota bacterium]
MDIAGKIFNMRSYTPIPFILLMLVYAHPTITSLASGFCIALAGESLRLWGVSVAGTETRTTGAVGGTHLFVDGPFSYVRNPLYVGNILMYVGVGIMSNALAPYLVLAAFVFFLFQYRVIVMKEEEYLQTAFGEEYSRYLLNVPRFFPRLTRYSGEHSFHRGPDISRGLHSERRTLQAFSLLTVAVVALYFVRQG